MDDDGRLMMHDHGWASVASRSPERACSDLLKASQRSDAIHLDACEASKAVACMMMKTTPVLRTSRRALQILARSQISNISSSNYYCLGKEQSGTMAASASASAANVVRALLLPPPDADRRSLHGPHHPHHHHHPATPFENDAHHDPAVMATATTTATSGSTTASWETTRVWIITSIMFFISALFLVAFCKRYGARWVENWVDGRVSGNLSEQTYATRVLRRRAELEEARRERPEKRMKRLEKVLEEEGVITVRSLLLLYLSASPGIVGLGFVHFVPY